MKIHKYIFLIEDDGIKIFKDGNLQKYNGETKYKINNNFEKFWNHWEDYSSYIEGEDKANFLIISNDLDLIHNFKDNIPDRIEETKENIFVFDDLQELLKDIKEVRIKLNQEEEICIERKKRNYTQIELDKNMPILNIIGEGVSKDLFSFQMAKVKDITGFDNYTKDELAEFMKNYNKN